jgi:branched-chain amino acid transport system permease protein
LVAQNWKYRVTNFRYTKLIALLLLVFILACIPVRVHSPYYMHLIIFTGMNAILAMTFIMMLRTGLISLGIAAFWGIGAYASAALVLKAELSFWVALPAATLITAMIAWAIGFLLVRNPGFSFLILTTIIGMLVVLVFGNIKWLGGFTGIEYIPPPDPLDIPFLAPILFTSKIPYFYLMLALFLLVCISFRALYTSSIGRAWMAIGLNPHLAGSIGVNVFRYRLIAFVIASTVTGLEGSFYAHYIGSINPHAFNIFKTIHIHIYAILGGIQFVFLGPIIGTFIMTFVPESLRIAKEIEPILTGALLILLTIFLPGGILSLLDLRHRDWRPFEGIVRITRSITNSPTSIEQKREDNNVRSQKP